MIKIPQKNFIDKFCQIRYNIITKAIEEIKMRKVNEILTELNEIHARLMFYLSLADKNNTYLYDNAIKVLQKKENELKNELNEAKNRKN
jgi:hypothetical protein